MLPNKDSLDLRAIVTCDNRAEHLLTFCVHLVHRSQWTRDRDFDCGSLAEIPFFPLVALSLGIDANKLDMDQMHYPMTNYATCHSAPFPEVYNSYYDSLRIRIYTDGVHTGYARLIREKDNKELLVYDLFIPGKYEAIHGPAFLSDNAMRRLEDNYLLSNISDDFLRSKRFVITRQDHVFAVHCPYWPVKANEWITRRRYHGFPTKSVIKQVVRYGCDFVQVSHDRISNENDWRFSFSNAEVLIAKTWTSSQLIVYSTLWVLNKKLVASSHLCTYYFKTLMFWACEEKPTQFWNADVLIKSVCELVIEMMRWTQSKFCMNYFMPNNNMLDHLIDTDMSCEIKALWKFLQLELISEIIKTGQQCKSIIVDAQLHIESPAWIKRAFVIQHRIGNFNDNYTDLFCPKLTTDLQISLYKELSNLYRGIHFQKKSIHCSNLFDKYRYFLKSERNMLLSIMLHESNERDTIYNCNLQFRQSFQHYTMLRCNTVPRKQSSYKVELDTKRKYVGDKQNSTKVYNEQKCSQYCRHNKKHENIRDNNYCLNASIPVCKKVCIVTAIDNVMHVGLTENIDALVFKEWPGRSPTVNISWFVSKAYLANLYYTTQRDVSLAIKTCDDVITVYNHSEMNHRFAEKTFPVVLLTQWSSIYDKEIQEILGFHSLGRYVLDKSCSRSVYIGVCPVMFALYIRQRIVIDICGIKQRINLEYAKDIQDHMETCKSSQNVVIEGIMTIIKALFHYIIGKAQGQMPIPLSNSAYPAA